MHENFGRIVVFLVSLYGTTYFAVSALFPKWPIRWDGRKRFPGQGNGPPMSVVGRIACGIFSAYVGAITLIANPRSFPILATVGVFLFIGLGMAYLRDRRRHKSIPHEP